MTRVAFLLLFAAMLVPAEDRKPNFTGTWELNVKQSEFTGMPAPSSMKEVIKHSEPQLNIKRTVVREGGEIHHDITLSTDNKEKEQSLEGNFLKSQTHWDGTKLVTELITDDGERPVKEVRELDTEGHMLVTTEFVSEQGAGKAKMIFDKK